MDIGSQLSELSLPPAVVEADERILAVLRTHHELPDADICEAFLAADLLCILVPGQSYPTFMFPIKEPLCAIILTKKGSSHTEWTLGLRFPVDKAHVEAAD